MSDGTKIEWTDATWNPVTGCSVVTPGCTNCYAMKLAGTRMKHHPSRKGLTTPSKAGPVWNGEIRFNEEWLPQPLAWKRPRMIFVCAHGDLFHENVPDEWIDRVFAMMALAPHHRFQVLTKRSARMRKYMDGMQWRHSPDGNMHLTPQVALMDAACQVMQVDIFPQALLQGLSCAWPLRNVWFGVSAEDQKRADERIPDLLATPAAVRFVSLEPLLGPIDLTKIPHPWRAKGAEWVTIEALARNGIGPSGIHWVITGGESGPHARPMHPDWERKIRDDCAAAGVPYFKKQWGEWAPRSDCDWYANHHTSLPMIVWDGQRWRDDDGGIEGEWMVRVGKKRAGRLLDDIEHNAMPGRA